MLTISRALKAPTQPILDFASLQHLFDRHKYLYASDKEDGIRCLIHPTLGPVTQTMKPIRNNWVRALLDHDYAAGLDGELVAVTSDGRDLGFNDTQSAIMSIEGRPEFEFRVFDCFTGLYDPYRKRLAQAFDIVETLGQPCRLLAQKLCRGVIDIARAEASALRRGKEGIMLRQPGGWYKEGRSTLDEGYLLKVKRFTDDEALVIDIEEEMENCNPATRDAGGLQRRSKHQAGLKGKGMVGKLVCKWRTSTIKIGSGMTEARKITWWNHPEQIIGKTITFKYQEHGMKDLPRTPILKGIRYDA